MSVAVLDRVEAFLATAPTLLTGYVVRFFRWTDEDIAQSTPFIMLRQPGTGGQGSALLQSVDVQVMLCDTPANVVSADARAAAIMRRFRSSTTQTGVVRFDPIGEVQGPLYLENGRPFWLINVRCYTEDQ